MKKLLATILAMALLLSFVGCKKQSDSLAVPEETPAVVDVAPIMPEVPVDEQQSTADEEIETIEQLEGTWANDLGHIVEISATGNVLFAENGAIAQTMATLVPCYAEDPQSEFPRWERSIRKTANGAYVIGCCATHLELWFFPVGVEMIRYNTNGSLVPSDTLRQRVFLGTFSLTTCCPDEEILLEVFYPIHD